MRRLKNLKRMQCGSGRCGSPNLNVAAFSRHPLPESWPDRRAASDAGGWAGGARAHVSSSSAQHHGRPSSPSLFSHHQSTSRRPLPQMRPRADTMDSPGSPLSELSSDEFQEDVKTEDRSLSVDTYNEAEHDSVRPPKRQRTGAGPSSGLANFRASSAEIQPPPDADADIYISEDTDGSVPASPHHTGYGGGPQDEESYGQEQVTVCKWEGCEAGDLGNMDKLVDHLHDDHIGTRQKKYSCEWTDCARKGIPHASGYALRAHMRSHTREKPFYCTLPGKTTHLQAIALEQGLSTIVTPQNSDYTKQATLTECDRAFTRSDALAKHMRTVHETEALRPSDPVPKHHSSNPSNKNQRLRLVFKNNGTEKPGSPLPASPHSQSASGQPQPPVPVENEYEHNNVLYRPLDPSNPNSPLTRKFPLDVHFTQAELDIPAPDLVKLLHRQIQWAMQEGEEVKAEVEALEKKRKDEWLAKELILENVMEAELGRMERVDRLFKEENSGAAQFRESLRDDVKVSKALDVEPKPNWRDVLAAEKAEKVREKEEVAASLADMSGTPKFDAAGDAVVERRPEVLGIGVAGGP